MTWDDVAERITGTPPAHLATASADGHPHVALVAPVVDGAALAFFTGTSSAKAADLRANPSVALVFEGHGAETYVWGTAEVIADVDAKRELWARPLPYDPASFFGAPERDEVVLVRVTPTRATVMGQGPDGPGRYTWTA